MDYREPAIYLYHKNNPRYATGVLPSLIPVVFGSGAKTFKKTVALRRGEGVYDVLPSSLAISITTVGNYENSNDYASTDYSLLEGNKITWSTELDTKKPATGATYYVSYVAGPEDDQYEPKLVSSYEEVEEFWGSEFKEDDNSICNIVAAANLVLDNGCRLFYGMQIEPSQDGLVTEVEYKKAFEKYLQFLPLAYRLVPLELDADINTATLSHVKLMSDPEERMERRAMFGAVHNSTTFTDVKTNVGGYAKSINYERVNIPYPDVASRRLSDGNLYDLKAPFICAAIAAVEASQPVEMSLTKSQINGFAALKGVKMLRAQKNLLASDGVMILEQPNGVGSPIEIRHGLTTDMSSVQTRENSIIGIKDFVGKYIREGLAPYIGRENITPEVIMRMKASANALLNVLAKNGVIVSGTVSELFQDADNPDAIIMKVAIDVPYPCNYIEVTLFLN